MCDCVVGRRQREGCGLRLDVGSGLKVNLESEKVRLGSVYCSQVHWCQLGSSALSPATSENLVNALNGDQRKDSIRSRD